MEIADSMKSLTENILTSYNVRVKTLGDLVSDTRKTLSDFAEERKNMAQGQNKHLSEFANALSKSVDNALKSFHKDRRTMGQEQAKYLEGFADDLKKSTLNMLNRYSKDHRHMSHDQAKNLAEFAADLTANVRAMLKGFYKDHQQMSDEQAKSLADFVSNLTRDVSAMTNGFKKTRSEMSVELKAKLALDLKNIRTYTKDKLKEFEKSHGRMSDTLQKSLSKYVNDLVRDVSRLLHGYRNDMKKAGRSWDRMSSTLSELRTGTEIPSAEAEERVSSVQEAIEEGFEQTEIISDIDVEMRVLDYINKHPEGVKVGSMESPLGVPRMRLGLKAKKLLEEGRVRKEANIYYPLEVFRGTTLTGPGGGFSTETH
jgi:hypothetical protein